MQRRTDQDEVEPHVFDQTNGVVDLGEETTGEDAEHARERERTIGGIAMLSANRPAG